MQAQLTANLAAHGLSPLGHFEPEPSDNLPDISSGMPASTVVLAGNAGSAFWPLFEASAEYSDGRPDPLNRWSARVLREIADKYGLGLLLPFEGPPWWPFQQWGLRAGNVSRSPLGVLAHHDHGLWFAYRGAFLLPETLESVEASGGPCETCAEKPCLAACPAGALSAAKSYDVELCRAHVAGAGSTTCAARGCLVRHACPFGQDHAYLPEQAGFHMRAFIA